MKQLLMALVKNVRFIEKNRKLNLEERHESCVLNVAARRDLLQIYELHRKTFPADGRSHIRFWFYWIFGTSAIFVAKTCDSLVGYSIYGISPSELGEHVIHEYFTGIDADQRGNGIGTAIRIYAQRSIALLGYRGISSQTQDSNTGSIRSLEKAGFCRLSSAPVQASGEQRSRWVRRLGLPYVESKATRSLDMGSGSSTK